MRDSGKILALARTVQAGASLCLVQKPPVSRILVSMQSRQATDGGRGDVPLALACIRMPRLDCRLPACVLVAFALYGQVSAYCCLSAGDEHSGPVPTQLTCPVCAIPELVFSS